IPRPAARAITSLISFQLNHFREASDRALSPHLSAVSIRLGRMLAGTTGTADLPAIAGSLAHLERLLADERTLEIIELCRLPLSAETSSVVAAFDVSSVRNYDLVK